MPAANSTERQIDHQWASRLCALLAYDAHWWLTWAGPFNVAEEQEWQQVTTDTQRASWNKLMKQSRQRELDLAWREQQEPRFHYPALPMQEITSRLGGLRDLQQEIQQQETNLLVRDLYINALEEEITRLELLQAAADQNTDFFDRTARLSYQLPSREEWEYAFAYVKETLAWGLADPATYPLSQQLVTFLQRYLQEPVHVVPELFSESNLLFARSTPARHISAHAAKSLFSQLFHECGFPDARSAVEPLTNARFDTNTLFLPEEPLSLEKIQHLLLHEFFGHAMRRLAGERSHFGLLGIGTSQNSTTEEGLALYHENRILATQGRSGDDAGIRLATFAIGMASGQVGKPSTFQKLWRFLTSFTLLRSRIRHPQTEMPQETARTYALNLCLRVFRGVPDLTQAGVCYPKDVLYLRGKWLIERAIANDPTLPDRLALGRTSLDELSKVEMLLKPRLSPPTNEPLPQLASRFSDLLCANGI